ncbi:MAG: hypothetical protein ACJ8FY_13270 [Gemmataceae bacterium]
MLADKSTEQVLIALSRALAHPQGAYLHSRKQVPGLFAGNAAGRSAAQHCKEERYIRLVRTEALGKATHEICAITEKGLAFLLSQVSPRQVLEDIVRALEMRQEEMSQLLTITSEMRDALDFLKTMAEKVLAQVQKQNPAAHAGAYKPSNGVPPASGRPGDEERLLNLLRIWKESGASEDCSLPKLYRQTQQQETHLTIGRFHDSLRRLYDQENLYLHPWTGPLYAMPEPAFALLVGHEIAYYASIRSNRPLSFVSGQLAVVEGQ